MTKTTELNTNLKPRPGHELVHITALPRRNESGTFDIGVCTRDGRRKGTVRGNRDELASLCCAVGSEYNNLVVYEFPVGRIVWMIGERT